MNGLNTRYVLRPRQNLVLVRFIQLACLLLIAWGGCLSAQTEPYSGENTNKSVVIGILKDGDAGFYDVFAEGYKNELRQLVDEAVSITYKDSPVFNANWEPQRVTSAVDAVFADDEVDIVLAMGLLVLNYILKMAQPVGKPVIGGFLEYSDILNAKVSGALPNLDSPNVNPIMIESLLEDDLRLFSRLTGETHIHMLVNPVYKNQLHEGAERYVSEIAGEAGVTIEFVDYQETAQETLDALPADTQALYMFPILKQSRADKNALIRGLNQKKILTFSMLGRVDVEAGVLAGRMPDVIQQINRRFALNIKEVIEGATPAELPSLVQMDPQLYINESTAVDIGFAVPFSMERDAQFISRRNDSAAYVTSKVDTLLNDGDGPSLTLREAVTISLENNLSLQISSRESDASYNRSRSVRGTLLPQVRARYNYARVDDDRPAVRQGGTFERRHAAGFQVEQVLFSDEAMSGYRSAQQAYESATAQQQVGILDTIEQTALAYISLLSARTQLRIAEDNLQITQSNLELARHRHQVGATGPEDVYRFESQEAADRIAVAKAASRENQARIALNQLLNKTLSDRHKLQNLSKAPPVYYEEQADSLISNPRDLEYFRIWSIDLALSQLPEIRAAHHGLKAQEIVTNQTKRRFVLPVVGARATWDKILDEDSFGVPQTGETEWTVGVTATFPVFEGSSRIFDYLEERANLRKSQLTLAQTRQFVEARVRSRLRAIEASHPAITFSTVAADRAEKNLELVTNKYESGAASIVDLLDAQNEAFVQRQNAALAEYNFLADLISFERAIGHFQFMQTAEENRQFFDAFEKYLEQHVR